MSGGMCAICKTIPAQQGAGKLRAYCAGCYATLSAQRRHKKTNMWRIGAFKNPGPKRAPTDWRQVLADADKAKGKP